MSHHHDHGQALTLTGRHRWRLLAVASLSALMFIGEVIGGLLSGSLALLADAAHLLTDSAGLVIALIATALASRPATKARTFGLQRAEILAAGANALLLISIGIAVLIGAITRFNTPAQISTPVMLGVALIGAVVNLIGLGILRGGQAESLNLRGAYLEVMGDLIGSVAVVVAATLISITGLAWIDSLAALVIFALIVPRAWELLREVLDVLLQATPKGLDLDEVRAHILRSADVLGVHDLHAWTITSGSAVLSAHVVVTQECTDQGRSCQVLDELNHCLEEHFHLSHCTLQLEPAGHADHERERSLHH